MINPEIIWHAEGRVTGPETCLSIPGITAEIERFETVRMRWTTLGGTAQEETLTGFASVCAQHELDHLDGVVTLDRLSPEARAKAVAAYAG